MEENAADQDDIDPGEFVTDREAVARVKKEIAAAFRTVPMPRRTDLLRLATGDETQKASGAAYREALEDRLGEKDWQSLDAELLLQGSNELSASAFRYYLPALLTACCDNFTEDNGLLHTAIWYLTPDTYDLCYLGKDERFDARISQFDRAQYDAVCSFLELLFDAGSSYRFWAAEALLWGWSKQAHPAHAKCREFFHAMHHFEYPPAEEEEAREIIAAIRAAFATTPYPGDDNICRSTRVGDDEPAKYALAFRGLDRRTLHPEFLDWHYPALNFFTGEAFRYFLPVYMIADLGDLLNCVDVVFHLTHGVTPEAQNTTDQRLEEFVESGQADFLPEEQRALLMRNHRQRIEPDWWTIATERFAYFSVQERAAIVRFLRYSARNEEDFDFPAIQEALRTYWARGE